MAQPARPALAIDRDRILQLVFMAAIALYLVLTLAWPLYTMLSKSMTTYRFNLASFEMQVDAGQGWQPPQKISKLAAQMDPARLPKLSSSTDGRLAVVDFVPGYSFRGKEVYRFRNAEEGAFHLAGSLRIADTDWHEYPANDFRKVMMRPAPSRGLDNYVTYFSTPSLVNSINNSLFIAAISTAFTVVLAFGFAYALAMTVMPFKGLFRLIVMIPILVPSLLPGIALVYMFGKQGFLTPLLMGHSIYGPIGIVIGSVFFSFPHAFIIIATALSLSDARLHEASIALKASPWKRFLSVTLPGARPYLSHFRHLHPGHHRLRPAQGDRRPVQCAGGGYLQTGHRPAELRNGRGGLRRAADPGGHRLRRGPHCPAPPAVDAFGKVSALRADSKSPG
jgi:iron(III) transport system permease protein